MCIYSGRYMQSADRRGDVDGLNVIRELYFESKTAISVS
jgi:hypothetical protein